MFQNFFSMFLIHRFDSSEGISPQEWNDKVLTLNIIITIILAILFSLLGILFIAIFSFLTTISLPGEMYWLTPVVILITTIIFANRHETQYFQIQQGYYGLIVILGKKVGSLNEPYHLEEGDFRQLMPIPYYNFNRILDAIQVPKKLPAMEFEYKDNKTKDGIALHGKYSVIPDIYDPWEYTDFELSAGEDGVRSIISEISLSVMDTTFDEYTIEDIFAVKDASTKVKENYYKNLEKHDECQGPKKNFWTNQTSSGKSSSEISYCDIFSIANTGLNAHFLIKTVVAPEKVAEAYNEKNIAKNKADAKAILDQKQAKVYSGIVRNLVNKNGHEQEAAEQKASLIVGLYSDEFIITLGGPNGKNLDSEIQQLVAAWLAKNKKTT